MRRPPTILARLVLLLVPAAAGPTGCSSRHPGFAPPDDAAAGDAEGGDDDDGDTGDDGAADAPDEPAWGGSVPCGASTCPAATEYCLIYVPDGGATPDATTTGSSCVPIPAACLATPTCACIQPTAACGTTFDGCVQAGGIAVTCTQP